MRGQGKDSTRLGRLSHDVADVVFRGSAEHGAQALRALLACCAEAVAGGGLLAMADEVDGGGGRCHGRSKERDGAEEGGKMHCDYQYQWRRGAPE